MAAPLLNPFRVLILPLGFERLWELETGFILLLLTSHMQKVEWAADPLPP